MVCAAPNPDLGTAMRISNYLDCNADLLGREGFLSLAGYGISSGLVAGLMTLSLALIGYRLIMGYRVDLFDGTNWILKVGTIFVLLIGWPVFQILFYDIVISGPIALGDKLLSAIGVSDINITERIQQAYDVIRLGTTVPPENIITEIEGQEVTNTIQTPIAMPDTANMLLFVSLGLSGSIKMAAAFLLSIAPFPILGLLFYPTYGLFVGWLRALVTTIFAGIAMLIVNGLYINVVESEISRIHDVTVTLNSTIDDFQAIGAITWIFLFIMLVLLFLSARLSGSIAELASPFIAFSKQRYEFRTRHDTSSKDVQHKDMLSEVQLLNPGQSSENLRIASVADALNDSSKREQVWIQAKEAPLKNSDVYNGNNSNLAYAVNNSHKVGRRTIGRKHRSAIRRDKLA